MMTTEKQSGEGDLSSDNLSSEMYELLQEEAIEGEILGAIDAAAEEGHPVTRKQAIEILLKEEKSA